WERSRDPWRQPTRAARGHGAAKPHGRRPAPRRLERGQSMGVTTRRLRVVAAASTAALLVLGAAACGESEEPASGGKPAKLVVDTFSEFGYDELVKQYEQQTGIKIELRKTGNLNDYRPKLVRYLATGKGAGDVVALEEGILNEFKANPANWVDLK